MPVRNSLIWVICVLLGALAGCAARPDGTALDPVVQTAGADALRIFSATDRRQVGTSFGVDRGPISYEALTLAPKGKTDFVALDRRRLDGRAFFRSVAAQSHNPDGLVVVFVHGYNTNYEEAVFRIAQLAKGANGMITPVLFSWPSQASVRGYVADRDSVAYARDDLAALLVSLRRAMPGNRIGVLGHSMGGWLVMEAMRQLRLTGQDVSNIQVGLAAPDIDLDHFRVQMAQIGRLSRPPVIFVSMDDRALATSRRLAEGRQRLGAVDVEDPKIKDLIRETGVQIIDISSLDSNEPFNHNRFMLLAATLPPPARGREPTGLFRVGAYVLTVSGEILGGL
jgi:esterase/lipase superfamily enzyme